MLSIAPRKVLWIGCHKGRWERLIWLFLIGWGWYPAESIEPFWVFAEVCILGDCVSWHPNDGPGWYDSAIVELKVTVDLATKSY